MGALVRLPDHRQRGPRQRADRRRRHTDLVQQGAQQPEPHPGMHRTARQAHPPGGQRPESALVQRRNLRVRRDRRRVVAGEDGEPDVGLGLQKTAMFRTTGHERQPPHQHASAARIGCAHRASQANRLRGYPRQPPGDLVPPGLTRAQQHRVLPHVAVEHLLPGPGVKGVDQPRNPPGQRHRQQLMQLQTGALTEGGEDLVRRIPVQVEVSAPGQGEGNRAEVMAQQICG
jgi:hypothetical protein